MVEPEFVSVSETRHRLANLVQLLTTAGRMRVQRAKDGETRRQLAWMLDVIGAVGVLQQRFLGPDGENFAGFLEDMLPHWRRRCAGRPLSLDLAAEPVRIREQSLSALVLIAHELVTNALTHGFPDGRAGGVHLTLRRLDDGSAVFSVADDGCGYDPAKADKTTLGLWLVQGLAAQVRGRLTTTAGPGGVTARLEFPAA
jgi:two-component sensor histidine kinase